MRNIDSLSETATIDVQHYFTSVADELGIDGDLTMVSYGPPSWVAIDNGGGSREAEVALRLTHAPDADAMLADTTECVDLLQNLRSHGAQVVEHLEEPRIIRSPQQRMGGYVLTVSRYLPTKDATPFEHGQALASLHNASLHVDTRNCEEINILEQITPSGQVAEYLQGFQKRGKSFQLGQVAMSPEQIETYVQYLDEAETRRRDLFEASARKGLPEVVVQEDVHDGNIMRDSRGVPIAIDIDGYIGPSAIDFGRPLNDWHHRFGHPLQRTHDFVAGYEARIDPQINPDQELREMARDYINIRSSIVFIGMAVSAAMHNQSNEQWLLNQGLHRMQVIPERDTRWLPLDEARKIALRSNSDQS